MLLLQKRKSLRDLSGFLAQLVVGEMDMILGEFSEDPSSFEAAVFRIWAGARHQRDLEKQFRELGDQLSLSRRRYEDIKRLDEEIFDG